MLLLLARRLFQFLPPDIANQVRSSLFRVQAAWHRVSFGPMQGPAGGWPILLEISVLKSGTHLLDQILTGFSKVSPYSPRALYLKAHDHNTGRFQEPAQVIAALDAYRPLDVIKAHFPAQPALIQYVSTPRFLIYFIYRDPRDVVVSLAHYGFIEAGHKSRTMFEALPMEGRIRHLIVGGSLDRLHFEGINAFYRQYFGWLESPLVLHLRYEDLIHRQRDALLQIVDHFLRRVDSLPASREQITAALEANLDPRRSPTFRRGGTGDWRTHFSAEHKSLFKEHTGDLLERLGYEKNDNW